MDASVTLSCDTSGRRTAIGSRTQRKSDLGQIRRRIRVFPHLLNRNGTWYWWRRLPRHATGGTTAESKQSHLRVSLRTTDRRLARSLALRLDGALERMLATGPLPNLNLADLCAAMRREAQVRLAEARAVRRGPDAPCPVAAGTEIRLADEMTRALERFADRLMADNVAPEDSDGEDQALPDGPAEALIAASAAAPKTPARPRSTGAAHERALAAKGRAGMLHRALLRNDLDMVAPALDALLPRLGVTMADEQRALVARATLRVLAGIQLEESERELGLVGLRPEDDPVLAAIPIPARTAAPCVTSGTARTEMLQDENSAQAEAEVQPSSTRTAALQSKVVGSALAQDALFSAVIDHAIGAERRAGRDGKTVRDLDVAGRLFREFAGDCAMAALSWADVAVFRDEALRLPRLHGRSIFAKLTPDKAIELANAIDDRDREAVVALLGEGRADDALRSAPVERMSKKTVNKHLSSLAGAASPSHHQMRCTRLAFTCQPRVRSIAVTRR